MLGIMDEAARAYIGHARCGGAGRDATPWSKLMADDAHILVVDDDARLRGLLSRYLAGEGFRVTTADNAADARAKLRAINPDLLVLDVMMPGESGLDLTASLRREQGHDLPVLLLTARGAPEDRIAGFEAGADDYLRQAVRAARAGAAHPRHAAPRPAAAARATPPARCNSARWCSTASAANCATPTVRSG